MRRRIILVAVLLIVVVAGVGLWKYFEKAPNYAAKEPDVAVTAKEFLSAFDKDTAAASKRFMDKIVRVTGRVQSFDSSAVVLGEEGSPSSIVIGLDKRNQNSIAHLKVGETGTLQGKFSGYRKSSGDAEDLLSSLGTTVNVDYGGVVNNK